MSRSLSDQLCTRLLLCWRAFDTLARATPPQLLAHTAGLPDYFNDEAFAARLREDPDRAWRPIDLVDHAATHRTSRFQPGEGFAYSDTGYVIAGILIEQVSGSPLHEVYRELVFDEVGMDSTWLEGYEPRRVPNVAYHYSGDLDMSTLSPTIDWAGRGLVTTIHDLARFLCALWSGGILDSRGARGAHALDARGVISP